MKTWIFLTTLNIIKMNIIFIFKVNEMIAFKVNYNISTNKIEFTYWM